MLRYTARSAAGRVARAFHSASIIRGGVSRGSVAPKVCAAPSTWQRTGAPAGGVPWSGARGFAATAKSDTDLRKALQAELEVEKESYQPLEFGPPEPWTVEEKPDSAGVILRRAFGKEDIAVTYVAEPEDLDQDMEDEQQHDNEDDDTPEDFSRIPFTVTVSKDGDSPPLEFLCVTHGGADISIDNINLRVEDGDSFAYDGPVFTSLDENLQKRFDNYLSARGVNEELATFIVESLRDKEQREYMAWLRKIEAFVKK